MRALKPSSGTIVGLALIAFALAIFVSSRVADSRASRVRATRAIGNLVSPTGPGAAEPNLAVAPNGHVYLSWIEPAPDTLFALRLAILVGDRWSEARTIATGADFVVNWADFPSMVATGDGRLWAHWLERVGKGGSASSVRVAQSFDNGRTWSPPVVPHLDSSRTEHGFVSLWSEGATLGAVWLDGRKYNAAGTTPATGEMMVVTTTVGANGAPGAEVTLDQRACDCCQTAAAITASGPIVAYRDRSADEIRDIYLSRRVEGRWLAGAAVHADGWKIASCPVNGPAIAASGSRVALAWFTAAQDTARVLLAFSSDAGATFGAPVRVDNGQPAGRVHVALLGTGDALVTWLERTGGDTAAVRVRRVAPDGSRDLPITIAVSSGTRASGFPRLVVSGDNVVFAWTEPGSPSTVRVARALVAALR